MGIVAVIASFLCVAVIAEFALGFWAVQAARSLDLCEAGRTPYWVLPAFSQIDFLYPDVVRPRVESL
ncbi:hypothetical protein DD236_11520 [Ancrocorticia populi]|uniref:Uncharacterized protein n=1 Tax=Ancrocorticia populi TaxID=2175228 RepID=A0A2V1K4F9_9ACTO|nr:hypothetical protein DD236_11520 [Ancrocorticia populi]